MVTWETTTIGECAEIISGGTPSTTVPAYWDGGILWCTPTDITKAKSKYLSTTERTISDKGLKDSAAILLPVGTILLCSRATIGEMCIAAKPISTNQGFKNLVCGSGIDNNFMYYLLQTKIGAMFELAIGSTFLEISKKALASIEIPLPPLPEQRRIAAALSDTDALITALERLIAKKRAIKQGAMQELLTGKRRLPGFEGEWVETTIGDLGIKLLAGYAFKSQTYITNGKYKIVTIANVQQNELDTKDCSIINELPSDLQEHHLLKRGDILISLTGNVGRTCIVNEDFLLLNQRVGLFFDIKVSKSFFFCVLQGTHFIAAMIAGAKGGAQPNLGNKDVYGYKLSLPPTVAEQTAIAEILSDMDAEIDALTAKLNKLRSIKQGMMSELLTGRIRLVEQDATTITEI